MTTFRASTFRDMTTIGNGRSRSIGSGRSWTYQRGLFYSGLFGQGHFVPIGRLFRTCSTGANTTITSSAIVANNYLRGREVIEHFDAFGESRFSGTDYAKFLGRLKLTVQVVEMSLYFFLNGFVSGYFRFKDQGVDAAESVIVRVLTADCLGVAGVFLLFSTRYLCIYIFFSE